MRAITRMRTLAALCALLMMLAATPVTAWVEKPIDTPQGPPVVSPTEVGDPDAGNQLPRISYREILLAAFLSNPVFQRFVFPLRRAGVIRFRSEGVPRGASR